MGTLAIAYDRIAIAYDRIAEMAVNVNVNVYVDVYVVSYYLPIKNTPNNILLLICGTPSS